MTARASSGGDHPGGGGERAQRRQERELLRSRLSERQAIECLSADELRDLVERCEAVGLVHAAIDLCDLLLRRDPRDESALQHLALLQDEIGDGKAAAAARARIAELHPPPEARGDEGWAGVAGGDDEQLDESLSLVELPHLVRFVELFTGREQVHARQWYDRRRRKGGYSPVPEPLTPSLAADHLAGRQTLGSYLIREDGRCRHIVLDLDVRKQALEESRGDPDRQAELRSALDRHGQRISGFLGQLGIPSLLVDSGYKGRHLWIRLAHPADGEQVHALAAELVRVLAPSSPDLHLEGFPKQGAVAAGGLGNLVKLPLAIHRVSGRRAVILHADGSAHPRPMTALSRWRALDPGRLGELRSALAARPSAPTDIRDARSARRDAGQEDAVSTAAPVSIPPFTEEDLDSTPEIKELLDGCPLLARVVQRILAEGRVSHDMLVALRHTLGHLQDGPRAVNFLLGRCDGVPEGALMGRPMRGSPASCSNLRRRLWGIARRVDCDCAFAPRHTRATYPNPLLHLVDPDDVSRVRSTRTDEGGA